MIRVASEDMNPLKLPYLSKKEYGRMSFNHRHYPRDACGTGQPGLYPTGLISHPTSTVPGAADSLLLRPLKRLLGRAMEALWEGPELTR